MDLDSIERVARNPFAAGALGSLVALRAAPGATWLERACNVLAGAASAGICAPALAEWLQISGPVMSGALAFGVGMFGLSLAAAVMDGIRQVRLGEVITGWISRKG